MAHTCDFCGKNISIEHKMSCERCFSLLQHFLSQFDKMQKKNVKKRKHAKRIKKKVQKKKIKKEKISAENQKSQREIIFEKFVEKNHEVSAAKCASCEMGFLDGTTKAISCTEGKEPGTCDVILNQ